MNQEVLFFRHIDPAGRIVIPRDLRQTLGLESGDRVVLQMAGDSIVIRRAEASTGPR